MGGGIGSGGLRVSYVAPIRLILWAGNDANHDDHLHVEGDPKYTGTPPLTNPGMTPAVRAIYAAMNRRYGTPYYFLDPKPWPPPRWSHMGYWNRRHIDRDPNKPWSQHAYANALDIGPLYGVTEQQPIYDYLTGKDIPLMFTRSYNETDWKILWDAGVVKGPSWAGFRQYWVVEAGDRTDAEHLEASGNIVLALAQQADKVGITYGANVKLSRP